MTIVVGEKLPEAIFMLPGKSGPQEISTSTLFSGKKVVIFGVPGAFTPTCNNNHLPGYLDNYDAILAKGIDTIAVVAVNDVFVMSAWAHSTGAEGKITFLADGSGNFVKAIGLDLDMSAHGLGLRAKRFSMIVEDGVVMTLNVEDSPANAVTSGAAKLLEQL